MYDYFQQLTTLAPQFSALLSQTSTTPSSSSKDRLLQMVKYIHF